MQEHDLNLLTCALGKEEVPSMPSLFQLMKLFQITTEKSPKQTNIVKQKTRQRKLKKI